MRSTRSNSVRAGLARSWETCTKFKVKTRPYPFLPQQDLKLNLNAYYQMTIISQESRL